MFDTSQNNIKKAECAVLWRAPSTSTKARYFLLSTLPSKSGSYYMERNKKVSKFLLDLFTNKTELLTCISNAVTRCLAIHIDDYILMIGGDKRTDRSKFEMESCLLFPLGDIPNHRFSNSQNIAKIIDLKHFEEDGRFFIHTEPGYISFETNAIYNQHLNNGEICDDTSNKKCEEYNFVYLPQASNSYMLYAYGIANIQNPYSDVHFPLLYPWSSISEFHSELCQSVFSVPAEVSCQYAEFIELSSLYQFPSKMMDLIRILNVPKSACESCPIGTHISLYLAETLSRYGFISFYNEVATVLQTEQMITEFLETKRTIFDDLKEVRKVKKDLEKVIKTDCKDKVIKDGFNQEKLMFFRVNALETAISEKMLIINQILILNKRMAIII